MKLIVSTTCPYAQRAWITANALALDCDIEIIDLKNKPEWFVNLTPFGQVPVLIDDQQHVLWESLVVANYLNQLQGSRLSPKDAFVNALNEAWIGRLGNCLSALSAMATAINSAALVDAVTLFQQQLRYLDTALQHAPYFNGQQFCLIDIFYAPIFVRVQIIAEHHQLDVYGDLTKVAVWATTVLAHPAVQQSIVDDFAQLYAARFLF